MHPKVNSSLPYFFKFAGAKKIDIITKSVFMFSDSTSKNIQSHNNEEYNWNVNTVSSNACNVYIQVRRQLMQ